MMHYVMRRTFDVRSDDYDGNLAYWLDRRAEDGLELVTMSINDREHVFVFREAAS